jgi:RNA polymerase sigma-70 factor, ECF subfamily
MALRSTRFEFDRRMSASLPAALRFAVRLTGRLDTAEDVVQEAMLAASRYWKTYRGESQFNTWLLRIVVNTYRSRLAQPPSPEPLCEEIIDRSQTPPSELVMAAELSKMVTRQIADLPLRQREVIVLSAYEGLDAVQIAEVLGLSVANVYSTLSIARAKLRSQLEPYLMRK